MDKADLRIEPTITDNQIKELIHHSANDQEVISKTSDATRFKDKQAFDIWIQSKPSLYVLTNKTNKLLGLAWVQKMLSPIVKNEYDTTAAIRLYGEARGRGLSKWFLGEALNKYGNSNYWLRTSSDNVSAIKTYKGLGFKIASSPDEENKIILIRHSSYSSLQ